MMPMDNHTMNKLESDACVRRVLRVPYHGKSPWFAHPRVPWQRARNTDCLKTRRAASNERRGSSTPMLETMSMMAVSW